MTADPGDEQDPPLRRPVIGVMGSGQDAHAELAVPLGKMIARLGCHLLAGGGRGTMTEVARGFAQVSPRVGHSIGILRGRSDGTPIEGYPNPFVEIPIHTHLDESGREGTGPLSRNHLNVLSSSLVVALPGGPGTRSEIELAIRYGRRTVVHDAWADAFPSLDTWRSVDQCEAWLKRQLADPR